MVEQQISNIYTTDEIEAIKTAIVETMLAGETFSGAVGTVAKIATPTAYEWRKKDPDFEERVKKAMRVGREMMCDKAEKALGRRIGEGSDTAICYALNNLGRERGYNIKADSVTIINNNQDTLTDEQKKNLAHYLNAEEESDSTE